MADPTIIGAGGVMDTMSINTDRIIPQVSRKIRLLDANIAPFTHLMRNMRKEPIKGVETIWWEDQRVPQWSAINHSGGYNAAAVSLVVDHGQYFVKSDIIKVPRTGEIMRVTADPAAHTLTVTRSVGSTAAAALLDNEPIWRIGTANEEYSLSPKSKMTKVVKCSNYLQIWRIPVVESETSHYTEKYTGDDLSRQRLKKRQLLMIELEKTALFSEKSEVVGPEGHPLRTAGGICEVITTNRTDMSAAVTNEAAFREAILYAFDHAETNELFMFTSNFFCDRIDSWGRDKLQTRPKEKTYGVNIKEYMTTLGTLNIINHRLLRGAVYGTYAIIVDMSKCAYVPQTGQDIRLVLNRQENDRHGEKDEWMVTAGYKFEEESSHTLLYGIN